MVSPRMPASLHAFALDRTYTALAGSSSTRTTDKPGTTPFSFSRATSSATSSRTRRPIATPSMSVADRSVVTAPAISVSACKVHRPRFSDHYDLDLTGVLQLRLDATRNFLGKRRHADVVHVVGRHEHPDLSACLNREHLLHPAVARRDPLEPLETLHVGLEGLAPGTGPRARDGVGGLDEHGDLTLVRDIVVMRGNAVHDERMFAVLRRDLDAELHVRAFVFVREHLADVVQERASLRHRDVEPELRRHDPREECHFLRMGEDILAIARAPLHAPDALDELRVEAGYASFVRGLFAGLDDPGVDFPTRLVDDFLDAPRVNAPIGDELLECDSRHLAAHRIEARDDDGSRSVVDDDVDARRELERADVSPLAADDTAFHSVVWQRNGRDCDLGRLLSRNALYGEGNDLSRL